MKTPELLAPAGSLETLRYAFAYGADAVYAGLPRYSLRVRNNAFDRDGLAAGIGEARARGRRLFVACNLLPHNAKVKTFLDDLAPVAALGPDALIMADPGLIMLVRERWPELPIHLSVQANTLNHAAVRFWQSVGIRRVILSRELSLDEIEAIRQHCPDVELEVFVHGALCIAYSGRCLLSGYFNHREANQGACTNACRWEYGVHRAAEDDSGDLRPAGGAFLLEERERPGQLMPVFEDEHGTYIMNSKDLRAVQHVARLAAIGVDALKIEGRTKSLYYAARTTQIYRRALDDALAGRPFDPALLEALENLANRGYTEGFYRRHPGPEDHNYQSNSSESRHQRFVGAIEDYDPASGLARVTVKNRFAVGDQLECILPRGNRRITLTRMEDLEGRPMAEAPGAGYRVRIPLPPADYAMGLLARELASGE